MLANDRLARHIADAGWGELRRQLAHEGQQRRVTMAPPAPSIQQSEHAAAARIRAGGCQ